MSSFDWVSIVATAVATVSCASLAGLSAACSTPGGLPAPPSPEEQRRNGTSKEGEKAMRSKPAEPDEDPYLAARQAVIAFYSDMTQGRFAEAAERLTGAARESVEASASGGADASVEAILAEGPAEEHVRRVIGGRPELLVDRHGSGTDRESETRVVLYNIGREQRATRIVVVREEEMWRIQRTERSK